jgi:hypothetical protein
MKAPVALLDGFGFRVKGEGRDVCGQLVVARMQMVGF